MRLLKLLPFIGITTILLGTNIQTVTCDLQEIKDIDVTPTTFTLTINSATDGVAIVDQEACTWYYFTNDTSGTVKVAGSLNSNMTANTALKANFTLAGGGTSQGSVSFTAAAQNLVTNITSPGANTAGTAFTMTFTATSAAALGQQVKTVTFTLADT